MTRSSLVGWLLTCAVIVAWPAATHAQEALFTGTVTIVPRNHLVGKPLHRVDMRLQQENSGLFRVGKDNELDLFFSRRICLDENGALVPIRGGGRLTGKVASTSAR